MGGSTATTSFTGFSEYCDPTDGGPYPVGGFPAGRLGGFAAAQV